jgi:glyoxylase-like metal-dependent hydrolase (beta-lactamase superfamily II)
MSGLDIRMFTVGPVQENAYIVLADSQSVGSDAKRALMVDPGEEAERLLEGVRALGVEIEAILITHCHFDHIGAVAEVARATGAAVYCPEIERGVLADINSWVPPGFGPFESYEADHTVKGGERLKLAGLDIDVVFTPGHSPGHVTYAIAASASDGEAGTGDQNGREDVGEGVERVLLSGDVLFQGSVGRIDLPGGDWNVLERSIGGLLRTFPAQTAVYPGHMGTTTLGRERDTNPFLQELRIAVSKSTAGAEPDLVARAASDAGT